MGRIGKVLFWAAVVGAGLAASAYALRTPLTMAMLGRVAEANAGRDSVAELADGLHVALCGTGSPFPDPARAGPCTAVIAGTRVFVVDAGEGSARNLARMGVPAARIEAILITHFHSDHIDGLAPLLLQRWAMASAQSPLAVRGPAGIERVLAGLREAYASDTAYRVAHHTQKVMPPDGAGGRALAFTLPPPGQGDTATVIDDGGLKVTAFRVRHAPVEPAVGYRFDYKGRSVVISGDTAKTPTLVAAARGADLLLHEALQPRMVGLLEQGFAARSVANLAQIMRDIVDYHSTPEEAAQQAAAAGVRRLVLNHIVPPLPARFMNAAFLGDAARHFAGPIIIGVDGMVFSLPAGGDAIVESRAWR
ncbi:MAG: MBL fold metallo-hydrolase [Burkholderiales bacterium]